MAWPQLLVSLAPEAVQLRLPRWSRRGRHRGDGGHRRRDAGHRHAGHPVELVVDRPYLFVIHDVEHATPLFLGRVSDPRS